LLVVSYLISIGLLLISIFVESAFPIDIYSISESEALLYVGFGIVLALFSILNSLHLFQLVKNNSNQRLLFSVSIFTTFWLVAKAFGGVWNLPSYLENIKLVQSFSNAQFEKVDDDFYQLNGHIGLQTLTSFKTIPLNERTVIKLESGGGLIEPAIEIANLVSLNKVTVYIDKECSSACVLIAIKAKTLIASPQALFGFHRGSSVSKKENSINKYMSEKATETLRFELENNGVDESILKLVTTTDNESISYLTGEELFNKGLVDSLYP
jgi:ATP-dependent protease ClpP protease subunit/heme/copper-type cytochrome/quinol oxidase subunit 4